MIQRKPVLLAVTAVLLPVAATVGILLFYVCHILVVGAAVVLELFSRSL